MPFIWSPNFYPTHTYNQMIYTNTDMKIKEVLRTGEYEDTPWSKLVKDFAKNLSEVTEEDWFDSLRINCVDTNSYHTMEEAEEAAAIYVAHGENIFSWSDLTRVMEGHECAFVMLGMNVSDTIFSVHIEAPEGVWLPPVVDIPWEYMSAVIQSVGELYKAGMTCKGVSS